MREGSQQNIPESIKLFDIFSEQIAEVVKVNIKDLFYFFFKIILFQIESFKYAIRRYRCFTKCFT